MPKPTELNPTIVAPPDPLAFFVGSDATIPVGAGKHKFGPSAIPGEVGTLGTDEGLTHLKKLQMLTALDLQNTKATENGVQDLATALPGCRIKYDGGVIEPRK